MLKASTIISVFTFVMLTSLLAPKAFAEPVEMLVSKKWGAYRYDNDAVAFVSLAAFRLGEANMIRKIAVILGFLCRMVPERQNVMWCSYRRLPLQAAI